MEPASASSRAQTSKQSMPVRPRQAASHSARSPDWVCTRSQAWSSPGGERLETASRPASQPVTLRTQIAVVSNSAAPSTASAMRVPFSVREEAISAAALTLFEDRGVQATRVEDIAKAAGSLAHVASLRRTQAGPFGGDMVTIDTIQSLSEEGSDPLDALLLPAVTALRDWPMVHVNQESAFFLRQGQAVQVSKAPSAGTVAIIGPQEDLIGIGEILDDGRVGPRRVLAAVR